MTQQEVIRTFMQSLNDTTLKGGAALNEAIKASSNFKSFSAVRKQFLDDLKAAKNWHTFLVEKCGIILDNTDTGAISGSDAGGKVTKTATDILPSTGEAQYPEGSSFIIDGLTIFGIPDKKFLTADQQYVITGLYSWWLPDALELIKESYGFSFTDVDTTNSRLQLKFENDPDDGTFAYVSFDNIDGDDKKVYESRVLCVNMAHFKNMPASDHHGSTEDIGWSLDRTLVHELVHGLMASNVNYFNDIPDFLAEGGSAELIHGLDDERYEEIIEYAKDPEAFETILTTKMFDDPPYEIYAGGYIFMRYYAKQAADTTFAYDTYKKTVSVKNNFATNYWDKVTMKGGKGADIITNSGDNVSIGAAAGNDTIKNYGDTVKINAGAGDDLIFNEGDKITITGSTGNDSVNNSGDNVKIAGDAGNDALTNNGGDNVSISGGADNDFIWNSISYYETLEALTAQDVKDEALTSMGATVNSDGNYYAVDLRGGNKATIRGGEGDDTITNHATNALIYGDAGNNVINNYGYNATIYGGDDSDTVTNGKTEIVIDGDNVSVTGYESTIFVGDGDDSIDNSADCAALYGEGGDDTFTNRGWNVSIDGGIGDDSVENRGNDAYVTLGDGDDEIVNYANFCSMAGDAGEDILVNFGNENTMLGGDDDDEIYNYGDYSSLLGDAGDDYIYSSGEHATLNGGAGDDYFCNEGVYGYLIGGKGNDTLYNEGDHITLAGGAGNDYLENWYGLHITYEFGKSDGLDTVVGFNDGDTIQITSGTHSAKKSGNNVIITVGKAKLTLLDAVDKTINFVSAAGKTSTKTFTSADKKANASTASLTESNFTTSKFLTDNNFVTANDFSELIRNNSAIPAVADYPTMELDSLFNLKQKSIPVAYSSKK